MDDKALKKLVWQARKDLFFLMLKNTGLLVLATMATIIACVITGISNTSAPGVLSFMNVMFLHFGYTMPKLKEISAKYQKILEDDFKKETAELLDAAKKKNEN